MIVVFGSINIDMVMQVEALPEPGQTVLCDDYFLTPGGKSANAALAASRAGARTALFGKVGEDDFAEPALALLREAGVDLRGVGRSARPTACASIWVDAGAHNAIVVASGANLDATADQVPDDRLGPECLLVLQMEVPPAENWRLARRAKSSGARVLLNVAPAGAVPGEVLRDIDFLVVNELEAAELAGDIGVEPGRPSDLARRLAGDYALTCIVTLGGDGALALGPDGGFSVPVLPVDPIDTTAAGDAFCGALAAALDRGGDLEQALRFASVGAGLACTRAGTQVSLPNRADIEARLPALPASKPITIA